MRKFYKFLLLSICFFVLGASAQAKVVSVVPTPTTLGSEDNSTGWWGALTDDIKAEAGSTYQVAFTNYSDCKANWNNFVLVLRKGDTSLGANGEYAVLRADNYGWGSSWNDCINEFKDDRNWDTWLAAMNGAKCAVRIYNHGDGFATVKMIMKGTNGVTYQQVYTNIQVDANDLYFAFTVENCHLNFTETTNEFDSLFDTPFLDVQLDTVLFSGGIDYKITSITDNTLEVSKGYYSSLKGALNIRSAINIEGTTYSVTSIGSRAFARCTGLTSVTIPNSVTSIGNSAFGGCTGLTSVTIPNSVTSIGSEAFHSCRGLTSIEIPNSVTSIGYGAFLFCSGLTSIAVDSGNAYYDSRDNSNAIIETATNTLIAGCRNTIIPNSVTAIDHNVFNECFGLTSVTIPNSVTSIGAGAFQACTGLTAVKIPNSVTSIGPTAFADCSGLTSMAVDSGNAYYDSRDNCNAIIETATNRLIVGCQNTIIPNSVTSIGDAAFQDCTGLTSVTIPNSVTSIGYSAFYGCTGLTAVTIPNSVTSIGYGAFAACTGLTKIKCLAQTPPACGDYVFNNVPKSTCVLEVPVGTKAAYAAAAGWSEFKLIEEFESQSNLNYSVTSEEDKTVEVTKLGENKYYQGDIIIPSSVVLNGITYSVTSIGEKAFNDCKKLTSIEIPNSVTSIGNSAFYGCSGLTSIEIPNSVTSIGSEAFQSCRGLTSVTIPNSVTSIGDWAFAGCTGLTAVEIPNSVTSIGYRVFYACTGLTSVEIPNSVTSIGSYAFHQCTGLTSVTIPNSVTSIGLCAFAYCTGLSSFTVDSGNANYDSRDNCNAIIETATNTLIAGCQNTIIPNSVTSIGDNAFSECFGLTSVTIPNSVTSIGKNAFSSCTGLTSVTIPNSVTSIGYAGFAYCSGLTKIKCLAQTPPTCGDYVFYNVPTSTCVLEVPAGTKDAYAAANGWSEFKLIEEFESQSNLNYRVTSEEDKTVEVIPLGEDNYYQGDIIIPSSVVLNGITYSVTSIGEKAFYNCTGLTSIEIPNSVTSIGYGAFGRCIGLTSITIPNSVTAIGYGAFYYCTGLTSIGIPNSVTTIGELAFDGCSKLTSVEIPNSVTSIGDYAFSGCFGLTSVTIPNSVTSIGYAAFEYCSGLTSMAVDSGNAYYDSRDNSNAIIESATNTLIAGCQNTIIPNSVTTIGYGAFRGCSSLTSVTIPNSVTSIGDYAFRGCTALTSVEIPNSVTSIGTFAFANCTGLTSIEIPNSVTSIGAGAFWFCTGLTSVTIPNSVTTIGNSAFYNCKGLTSVTIPNSVTSIGNQSFYGCTGLTSVTIPNSVTSIGDQAFALCAGLTSVTIPNSVTFIGGAAFAGCTGLSSFTVDSGNANYDSRDNCNAIIETATNTLIAGCKNTIIPNSVTSIGDYVFYECIGLTSVTIPNSVTSIGKYAFAVCTGLTKIKCLAQTPPTCGDNVFLNVPKSTCVLEVPVGTKAAYAAANGWSAFKNIVEAQDIEPAEEDVTVSFGNDINEETNLSDNVVNNTYYNLNSTNGDGYDATEQGIVLNSTTSADDLEAIAGLDISDEAVSANYHGLIIQVAAGSGTISVDVKTIGSHILNVKIGDGAPTQISKSERGTVDVPYNVSEPTYVYIYATSSNGASAPLHRVYRAPSANANSVILYGYGIKLDDTTAIDTLNGEQEALTDDCKIFTLGGQQVNELQPGMNIVRMKNGTVKKVFIK